MAKVTLNMSMSLDGFIAGPNVGVELPMGEGGLRLHDWLFVKDQDIVNYLNITTRFHITTRFRVISTLAFFDDIVQACVCDASSKLHGFFPGDNGWQE